MPSTINTVTADKFSDQGGATIQFVYESPGGWCTCNAQVIAQLLHSPMGAQQGQEQWSDEFVLPAGAHYIQRSAIGVRFRSFTPGNPVQVTAALFYRDEPAMVLGGSGIATPSSSVASLNFQHNDIAVATEPTADFEDSTGTSAGLNWTVVDDVANTRVKITPVFAATVNLPGALNVTTLTTSITGFISDVIAGNSAYRNFLLSTDTQPAFRILGNGSLNWGPGGSTATDTTWSRLGANIVGTAASSISTGPTVSTPGLGGVQGAWIDGANGYYLTAHATVTTPALAFGATTDTTQWHFTCGHDGAMAWGVGGTTAPDVTFARAATNPATGHLVSNGSIALLGSIYAGLATIAPVPTTSVTPDYNAQSAYIIGEGGTGGGTLTINNALNPPSAAQTGLLYIQINNPPGNTATALAWGGSYSGVAIALPTTIAQAGFWRLLFVWNGAAWLLIVKINA